MVHITTLLNWWNKEPGLVVLLLLRLLVCSWWIDVLADISPGCAPEGVKVICYAHTPSFFLNVVWSQEALVIYEE